MTSGSSADTTMTFGGDVAMPAVADSTVDDTTTISVDSATTDDKNGAKPSRSSQHVNQRTRARSLPRTLSSPRSSSTGSKPKPLEKRPSKTVMQCLQLSSKTKEREIRSPEKSRSKSSSRSSSRKAVRKSPEFSPPLVRRRDADQDPLPWAGNLGTASGSADNADALLDKAIHHHLHGNDPIGLQDQGGTSPTRHADVYGRESCTTASLRRGRDEESS